MGRESIFDIVRSFTRKGALLPFDLIWSRRLLRRTALVTLIGMVPMAIEYQYYLPSVYAEETEVENDPARLQKPEGVDFDSALAPQVPARLLDSDEMNDLATAGESIVDDPARHTTPRELAAPFSPSEGAAVASSVTKPERYQIAQVSNPEAQALLEQAAADEQAGRHVDAALGFFEVLDDFSDVTSQNAAQAALEDYAERALDGNFTTAEILEFAQRVPSYATARNARSKYIVVAFEYVGGRFAQRIGAGTMAQEYFQACLDNGTRFLNDHPQDPFVLLTLQTMADAAVHSGRESQSNLAGVLREKLANGASGLLQWSARSILGAYDLANGDPVNSYMNYAGVALGAEAAGIANLLGDESVYHTVRAWYLYTLAHANYNTSNNLGALEHLERLLADYDDADGTVVELAAFYRAFLLNHLATDPNEGITAFQQFINAYPDAEAVGDALNGMARRYVLEDNNEYARQVFVEVLNRRPGTQAAALAARSIEFIDRHLADLVIASNDQPDSTRMAQICGPVALHHLLALAGIQSTVEELTKLTAADASGATMLALRETAEKKGLALVGVESSRLEDLALPLIAYVNDDHFIVVLERKDDRVLIQDGLGEPIWTSLADFQGGWTHKALVTTNDARIARLLQREELRAALGGSGFPTNMYNVPSGTPPACTNQHHPSTCNGQRGFGGSQNVSGIGAGGVGSNLAVQMPAVSGPGAPASSLNSGTQATTTGINAGRDNVTIDAISLSVGVDVTDISIKTLGTLQLNFGRTYSNPFGLHREYYTPAGSGMVHRNNIGQSWTHTMNVHIRPNDTEDVFVLMDSSGNANHFSRYAENQSGFDLYKRQGNYGVLLDIHTDTGTTWQRGVLIKRNVNSMSADYGKIYMIEPDGHTYEFTPFSSGTLDERYARLVKVTDKSNNAITLSYDHATPGVGKLTRVDTPSGDGRYLDFTYHGNGQISRVRLMKTGSSTALKTFEYTYYLTLLIDVIEDGDTVHPVTYDYATDDISLHGKYLSGITDRNGNETLIDCDYYEIMTDYPRSEFLTITHPEGGTTTYDRSLSTYVNVIENWSPTSTKLSKWSVVPEEWGSHVEKRRFFIDDTDAVNFTFNYEDHRDVLYNTNAGSTVNYEYNTLGRVTKVRNGSNTTDPTWLYEYNSNNELTKGIDPNSRETTYTYNSSGILTKVVSPAHVGTNGVRYEYNSTGLMTKLRAPGPSGDLITDYEYDARGNVTKVTDPESNITQMLYDDYGNVTKLTDPRGKITWYDYDYTASGCSTCGGGGGTGRLTKVTDPESNEVEYEFDSAGNMTKAIDAYDNETVYEYDEENRLTKVTTEGGKITTTAYNAMDQVVSVTDPNSKTTSYEYDYMGRVTTVTNPVYNTKTEYDEKGNMTKVTDGANQSWTYAYDYFKRLTKVTDQNSKVTVYEYNNSGQVTKIGAGALGNVSPTTYSYYSTTGQISRVGYSSGGNVDYFYDTTGRLSRIYDPWAAFWSNPGLVHAYDDAGRLTTLTDYTDDLDYAYDAAGNVSQMVDYFGNSTSYTYTDRNRVSTITAPGSKVWNYDYDAAGRVDDYTHPNGMETDYQYDVDGRLTKIAHKDGGTEKQSFTYALDNAGNITRTTHEDGAKWDYEYDGIYRLTKAIRKNSADTIRATYEYTYSNRDNLITKITPWEDDFSDAGIATADWTTAGTWSASTGAAKNTAGAAAHLYKAVSDDNIEFRYSYSIDSYTAATPTVDVHFRYNTTSGERLFVRFRLDQAELRYHNGTAWTTYTDTNVDTTAGVKYNVRVEADGANIKVWRALASGGAETLIFSRTDAPAYNGDRLHFVVAVDTSASLDDIVVLADDLSRQTTYTYELNNELATMQDYNGTMNFDYDDWGRLTSQSRGSESTTYTYTYGSKVATVTSTFLGQSGTVQYVYSGAGKRLYRLLNSTVTQGYKWDAGFNVINEKTSGGALAKTYVVAPTGPGISTGSPMEGIMVNQGPVGITLAEVGGTSPATGDYRYYMHDQILSTRGIFDQSKASLGAFEFTPYGEDYTSAAPSDVTKRYTGLDRDALTGQYYAPYRYYDPGLSRWLTRDPLGMVDGPNVFVYLAGSPLMNLDPLGLASILVVLLLLLMIVIFLIVGILCQLFPYQCCIVACAMFAGLIIELLANPMIRRILRWLGITIGSALFCDWLCSRLNEETEEATC